MWGKFFLPKLLELYLEETEKIIIQRPVIAAIHRHGSGRNDGALKICRHSYTRFLFRSVGRMEIKPIKKSTDKVLKSYKSLTDFSSPSASPA